MRRTLVAATAVLTTAAIPLLPSSVPASQAAPPAGAPAGSAAPADTPTATATVTLITGDRVVTSGTGSRLQVLSVQPAAGREAVTFTRVHVEGHELAIPSDASALLSEERIDRRLAHRDAI